MDTSAQPTAIKCTVLYYNIMYYIKQFYSSNNKFKKSFEGMVKLHYDLLNCRLKI